MLVLVGRSCVGKDTIKNMLINEYGMERCITYTSRPQRNGEVDGIDYHFVDSADMVTMIETKFAEVTEYNVVSGETWFYGSLKSDYEDSDNKVIVLNPEGLKAVKELGLPIFAVQIDSPDKTIKKRQIERDDNPDEAQRRFNQDKLDFVDIYKYLDSMVINWGDGGPDRCARLIYDLYQYWLSKRSKKDVEDIS